MYGTGAAIGLSPRDVDQLTPWEFFAAFDGWRKANAPPEGPSAPTDEEHDALVAKYG